MPTALYGEKIAEEYSEMIFDKFYEQMIGRLPWEALFPPRQVQTLSIVFNKSAPTQRTVLSDTNAAYAREYVPGSKIPRVKLGEGTIEQLRLRQWAFGIKYSADDISGHSGLTLSVERTVRELAVLMAVQMNNMYATEGFNSFDTSPGSITTDSTLASYFNHFSTVGNHSFGYVAGEITNTYDWDTANADPLVDVIDLQAAYDDRDDYQFMLDTVLMDVWSAKHLKEFLIDSDYRYQPVPNDSFKSFTIDNVPGVRFVPLPRTYGMPTTKHVLIGYDSSWPPVSLYSFSTSDPHFSKRNGIDMATYYNNDDHLYYVDMVVSRGIALTEPKSLFVISTKAD